MWEMSKMEELKIMAMFLAQITLCKMMTLTELAQNANSKIFMREEITFVFDTLDLR